MLETAGKSWKLAILIIASLTTQLSYSSIDISIKKESEKIEILNK